MLHKKCAYFRMEDIGAYKASTIFVSQPFTVYEVDFFDSWYDFGWLQNRQSLCLDFFRSFKKWGAQPKFWLIFFQAMISCFKAIPSFFSKKRSPQMNILVFVYLTDWIFEYIFPSNFLWFWIIYGCSMFCGMLTFLEMLI